MFWTGRAPRFERFCLSRHFVVLSLETEVPRLFLGFCFVRYRVTVEFQAYQRWERSYCETVLFLSGLFAVFFCRKIFVPELVFALLGRLRNRAYPSEIRTQ